MGKNFFAKAVMLCAVTMSFISPDLLARERTPMEAFIAREKDARDFVPVTNIWQADNNFDKTQLLTKVENVLPLTIDYGHVADLMKSKTRAIELAIPKDGGGSYTIDLARYDFLTENFKVEAAGANGSTIEAYTPGLYYRGIVNGIPGSVAAFSFFNNEVYGIFSIPDVGNFVLVPNTQAGTYYGSNPHYILYNDLDLKIKGMAPGCATDQLPSMRNTQAKGTTAVGSKIYYTCRNVKVYELADYATYKSKGQNVTTVTNYITALFNNQSTIYRNEGVLIVLNHLKINTTTDTYQSVGNSSVKFLNRFGAETQNNLYNSDLGILVTTRYGSMGGVAWLQAMCQPYQVYQTDTFGAYAICNIDNNAVVNFPTYSWDVEVMSHEMGHLVGSPHTHACAWNPPARNTAIDGCYTIEGACATPNPAKPAGGGTVMSYCHLTNVGINFSKGFGQQPGDSIRTYINSTGAVCATPYQPNVALASNNKTVIANRECFDIYNTDVTYYWYDNNTADQTDDTLVLMVKKNGFDIGSLDSAGFDVRAVTNVGYGGGHGDTVTFPAGTAHIDSISYAMNRYWQITPTKQPAGNVEVIFPFLSKDTSDVHGSRPAVAEPISNYLMYMTKNSIDPNPANNFPGATAAGISTYTYGGAASTTEWSLSNNGATQMAHMLTSSLKGGGTGFITYHNHTASVLNAKNGSGVNVYPNPTRNEWYVSVSNAAGKEMNMQVYSADGKLVRSEVLHDGAVTTINTNGLAAGVYYYRVVSNDDIYIGNLVKQ